MTMNKLIHRITKNIFLFLLFLSLTLYGQIPKTPLEKNQYKKTTSYSLMISYIDTLSKLSSKIEIENIGYSVQSRLIPMVHVKQKKTNSSIKVLLFAQQHGNEPSGKEAALLLLKELASEKQNELFKNLDLYIIPCLNPDGSEAGTRNNANNADINRDHLILTQPEIISLHKIFTKINPEVTLDIHEFSAYRKEFRDVGYFRNVDEQFGAPTNLNISKKIINYSLNKLFPYLEKELSKSVVRFASYLKMNTPSDTARESTTSIDDGRQSFGIRNHFSFILEGKNGRNLNDELYRRANNQLAAIKAFLSFVNKNSKQIFNLVASEKQQLKNYKKPIAVKMDYLFDGSKISLPMTTVNGKDTTVSMLYAPKVTILESVNPPDAYLFHASQKNLIDFLDKHSIPYHQVDKSQKSFVEIYTIKSVGNKWMENKSIKNVTYTTRQEEIQLQTGDIIVPLNNEFSVMLVIAFEPASMWGLVQYKEFSNLIQNDQDYPIYRITKIKRK